MLQLSSANIRAITDARHGTFYVKRIDITSELERTVYDALDGIVYKEAFQHMSGFAFDR